MFFNPPLQLFSFSRYLFFVCTLLSCNPNYWVGFLGIPFEVEGGVTSPPGKYSSKYISKKKYVVSENRLFSTKALLILLMPGFFCKKSAFFCKNSTFTLSNSVRAVFSFKWLSYCFQETRGFDVKASFTSRLVSRLIS